MKHELPRISFARNTNSQELLTFRHKASLPGNDHCESVCTNLSFQGTGVLGSLTQRPGAVLAVSLARFENDSQKSFRRRSPLTRRLKNVINHNMSFHGYFPAGQSQFNMVYAGSHSSRRADELKMTSPAAPTGRSPPAATSPSLATPSAAPPSVPGSAA